MLGFDALSEAPLSTLPTAAGGTQNYILTCAVGSYTYTGNSATLTAKHNYSLICAVGAYTYSGISTTSLKVVHSLVCSSGAYSYTGNVATLAYVPGAGAVNYVLTCSVGAYSYVGKSATLTYVTAQQQFSGGYEYAKLGGKRRTKKEIEKAREKFGLVFDVVQEVALRQSEDLHLDSQQQLEELTRELELQGLQFEAKHLEMLNIQREQLINEEIGKLLRKKMQKDDEEAFALLMMSLVS